MSEKKWMFNKEEVKFLTRRVLKTQDRNVRSLVIVKYVLPFEIPFEDQSRALFNFKGNKIAIISKKIKIQEELDEGLKIDKYITEIEIAVLYYKYIDKRIIDQTREDVVSLTFEFLNHILTSLMIKFNPGNVRRISRQDLHPLIPVKFVRNINFKEESIETFGIENLHHNIPYKMENLNSKDLNELISFANRKDENPYYDSLSFLRESRELIKKGMYQSGIIGLQTSIEMFMYLVLQKILYNKENKTSDEVKNILKAGYKNIINEHLKKHFKDENYTFEFISQNNSRNLLDGYKSGLYELRNKIVHEGKRCTEMEAIEAEEAAYEMLKEIVKAINSSKLQDYAFDGQELLY